MKKGEPVASLLPCLDAAKGPVYLRWSLTTENASMLEKTPFPFLVMQDTDPIARMVEAQFLTDAGSLLKKVFVLVQKDRYSLPDDALWPVTNLDVERAWQNSLSYYAGAEREQHPPVIAAQIDEGRRLVPQASLFFCKTTQRFFHPVCPTCMLPLQLCTSDGVLSQSGLQSYSKSLKRYLWCASCGGQSPSGFYVYEVDRLDPPALKDCRTLIKELGVVASRAGEQDQLPCAACGGAQECFGPTGRATSRVVPFSFYPFYMLIFEAMSLNAIDFLMLLSGAPVGEVEAKLAARGETGRVACLKALRSAGALESPFLYSGDEKFFLEVLYLKLSFLGELARSLTWGKFPGSPGLPVSLDRVWVRLAGQSGLLPSFWNFSAEPLDMSKPLAEAGPPVIEPARPDLYSMGLAWLYGLLVNSRQDMAGVLYAIRHSLGSGSGSTDASSEKALRQVSAPANLFWDPDGTYVDPAWVDLWKNALDLGWSLLMVGIHEDRALSKQAFEQQLEDVRKGVREALFEQVSRARAEPCPAEEALPSDDDAIREMLLRIRERWYAREPVPAGKEIAAATEAQEALLETRILSAGRLDTDTPAAPPHDAGLLQETVILSTQPVAGKGMPAAAVSAKEEAVAETVILSAAQAGAKGVPGPASREGSPEEPGKKKMKKPDEEFSAETVILKIRSEDK